LHEESIAQIEEMLEGKIEEIKVVTMPDFFLDRVVNLNVDVKRFNKKMESVIKSKGGSIDRVTQTELRGGNAVNTASALTALGLKVVPIICTDKTGFDLIEFYLDPGNADLSHIKILGKQPSMTTALEFQEDKERVNVMLRDVGALEDFGPDNLDDRDYEMIEKADYVCVFNWAGTKRFGTKLAENVFKHTKKTGKGKTFLDTADPRPNNTRVSQLIKNVLMRGNLDILSLNENEAFCYAIALNKDVQELCGDKEFSDVALESARILATNIHSRIDLHTKSFSGTFTGKKETIVPSFEVSPLRTTGAGDAWNAGNILADAVGLPDESRLILANAVAAYYVCSQDARHPTRKQLSVFIKNAKLMNLT
jgi:sugar/nucleoside kinase (ribokinase family)